MTIGNNRLAITVIPVNSLSAVFTQGRLLCTKLSPDSRFIPTKISSVGLHGKWVRLRYAVTKLPYTFTPSIHPLLAKQANTRNFIDMPFNGILPPSSVQWKLTRILHHYTNLFKLYHIIVNLSRVLVYSLPYKTYELS